MGLLPSPGPRVLAASPLCPRGVARCGPAQQLAVPVQHLPEYFISGHRALDSPRLGNSPQHRPEDSEPVPQTRASAPPGNLLQMLVPGPGIQPRASEPGGLGASVSVRLQVFWCPGLQGALLFLLVPSRSILALFCLHFVNCASGRVSAWGPPMGTGEPCHSAFQADATQLSPSNARGLS